MTAQSLDAAHAAVVRDAAQPAWLKESRRAAWNRFTAAGGFPTPRREEWKYTDLKGVAERLTAYLAAGGAAGPADRQSAAGGLAPDLGDTTRIVLRNGRLDGLPDTETGLRVRALSDSSAEEQQQISAALAAAADQSAMADFNVAFLTSGLLIDVAPGCRLEHPVQVVCIGDGLPQSAQTWIMLRLGANSEATLLMQHQGSGATSANTLLTAHCAAGARLDLIKLQDESPEGHHLATQHIVLEQHSRLQAVLIDLGSSLARNDLRVDLAAAGAEATVHGLFVADADSHIDYHTCLDHRAAHTRSQEVVRGIAADRGRGVFNGKIRVHKGADGTDAGLSNRNLLLNIGAEIDTKPELEIYADEVKCAHGATTGQLDAAALFYLRSRGVDLATARGILVGAFAGEIIERLELPQLRRLLETRLSAKLHGQAAELPA